MILRSYGLWLAGALFVVLTIGLKLDRVVAEEASAPDWERAWASDLGGWTHFDHLDRLEVHLVGEELSHSYDLYEPRQEVLEEFLALSLVDRQAFVHKRRMILTALAYKLESLPKLTSRLYFLRRFLTSAQSPPQPGPRQKSHLLIEALLQKVDGFFIQKNIKSLSRAQDMELYMGAGAEVASGWPGWTWGEYRVPGVALGFGLVLGCELSVDMGPEGELCLKSLYLDVEIPKRALLPTLLASVNGRMIAAASPQVGSQEGRFFEKINTYYLPGGPMLLRNDRMVGGGMAMGVSVPPLIATTASFQVVTLRFKVPVKIRLKSLVPPPTAQGWQGVEERGLARAQASQCEDLLSSQNSKSVVE